MVWFIFVVSPLVLITYTILLPVSAIQGSINITQGKSISVGQTIVSSGGNFALGFFSPGNSTNSYLGIWYNTIPKKTVIWVANRESPIPKNSNSSAVFTLGRDGNLIVLSGIMGEVIWSSDVRVDDLYMNSTIGVILDTGNLVLRRSGNEGIVLWQSFDHPTDTLMPGMKLSWRKNGVRKAVATSWADDEDPKPGMFNVAFDPREGRIQFYIYKQHDPYWRSNVFNQYEPLVTYNGSLEPAPYVTFSEEGDNMYLLFDVLDKSTKLRATITPKGQGQVLVWAANKWHALADLPRTKCDFYGACGPFASCEQDSAPASCSCLQGYKPYSQIDWDMGNRSGGCVRTQLSCNTEDTFQMIERVKLPDFSLYLGNMSAQECQLTCLGNCTCSAYAYFVGETTVNCFNWFGDLVDLVHNDFLGRDFYVRIRVSKEVDNVGTGHSTTFIKRNSTTIAATTVSFGLLLISVFGYVLWRKKFRRRIKGNMQGITDGVERRNTELVSFSFLSILAATDNFSEANKLGEGGFGPVYKGSLPEFSRVAVKRLSKKSQQGNEEFMNELKLIAKLQHKNLVRMLGCCLEGDEKILIYEYMPNRSLDTFIFNPSEQTNLDWNNRFRIIEGITQGLLYLHKYSRLKVIHRDLKAGNVLLDEAMNPKISDFGMTRILNINQTEANITNRVVGTYGYMSPEYALFGKFSEKSDVFSFGVLLLEIVSGRRNTGFYNTTFLTLLAWVWENWEVGKGEELIDPSIRESCTIQEVLKCINVGLLCVQVVPNDRPSMSRVAFMLSNEIASLPTPKQPGFSTQRKISNTNGSTSQRNNKLSNNDVTISVLEAR